MNELLWYVSRATGVVGLVLLTTVLVLGVITSGRRRPHGTSATTVMALHRWLALGVVTFLTAHVATAIGETYVSIDLVSAVVPFTSGYETAWVGLGTIAVDLLLALVVTSLLRHRIPERAWAFVHAGAWLLWPAALVHGFALGTADQPALRYVTVACGALGLLAVAWRFATSHADRDRREAALTQEWS